MTRSDIQTVLESVYPHELAESLLINYENALREFKKGNWRYFGNEIGQFIEVSYRMIEFQLTANYTPIANKLPNFNERILIAWENYGSTYDEVYRIIIPRCLYAMYCLRNKRGMIHKNHIDPNKMDATILLNDTKWILAEFFRLSSTLSFEETESIIDSIMCKDSSLIWDTGSVLRVLDTKMSCADKVLCLLYMRNSQTDAELRNSVEYKNPTEFKRVLKKLHTKRMIEYAAPNCILSPLGVQRVEEILK